MPAKNKTIKDVTMPFILLQKYEALSSNIVNIVEYYVNNDEFFVKSTMS